MIPPCPTPEELAVWLDREAGQRRAAEIQSHVTACSVCTAQIAALERLIAELRVPPANPASQRAIRSVMARLDPPARRAPGRIRWAGLGAVAAGAVAVAIAALVWRAPAASGVDEFQARGPGAVRALAREVGTTLYALRPGDDASPAVPLAADAVVRGGTAFVLGTRNLDRERPLWLLSFAIDAAGDIHWLYPGYVSSSDDPAAVPLAQTDDERMMPDSVVLDRPAVGELRVIVVISPTPLRVSAIEQLRSPELAVAALQRRFPDAAISELAFRVVP
ncbi:MAG TPA: hypothetical protein VGD37_27270 [Kofleriaceae bacterium]|jgi:hypothetical protein